MERLQAFKLKLQLLPQQARKIARFAGCKRFVYNDALAFQIEQLEKGEKVLGYPALCKRLTDLRHEKETSFLSEAPTHPLQQGLKDLDRGFRNFFEKRAKFPRFKRKGERDSFRYPDSKQFRLDEKNSRLFLPKLGWVKYRKSRAVIGRVKQITIIRESDGWYVCIQTEQEVDVPVARFEKPVGIDVGVAAFATMSDGTKYTSPIDFKKAEKKIAFEQRRLAKKCKGGSNWRQQLNRIRKVFRKVFNSRKDFQHKVSTTICKNHAVVVVEELNVKGMSASAKGTVDSPGTNVKAKSGLNRSILSQGWSEFFRQLEYKLNWTGGILIRIPPRNTSTRCSKCGHTSSENRTTQARFSCIGCGYTENADFNAAQNILAAGLAVLACGESPLGFSLKQEPTVSVNAFA